MSDSNDGSDTGSILSGSSSGIDSNPSLADTLESQFSDVPKNFNVVHINAQSIPAHYTDMLANLDCKNIHAILVSESWLKPCLPSTSYSLPGFQLIRNDRARGGGGGVAIYLRPHIPFTIVDMSAQPPPQSAGEHLFVEVILNNVKVLLGVYYSPSCHNNFFSSFEKLLEDLTPSYSHTVILGDFNTCLLKTDVRSSSLKSIVESSNLSILPLCATHHFPNCNPSLLDLIIVSSLQHVSKHGQCSADMFSYHDLLFLSYKIRPPKAKPQILLQRSFGGMNSDDLQRDANNIDWSPLFSVESMDDKINLLTDNLVQLYNVHAPIRAIKLKHLPAPWLTEDIRTAIHRKAVTKTKFKRRPTQSNQEIYIDARNHCNKMCRDAQRRHIHASVENEDPAKVWKFLKSMGVGKSRQETIPKKLDIDLLNQHFSSSSHCNGAVKAATINYLSNLPTPDHPPFLFSQFTDCDVKKSVMSITSNAVGGDCVSRKMILPVLNEILPILCHILNYSISSGVFPSMWKDAKIIPLPKKSNPTSFSEYRPISILPFLSKVLERLVHNQLSAFLCRNSLLNPFQSGFRPGHSTTTALINVTDDIRLGMERGNLTVLCLLDFSNAFNTVDFDILLATLRSLNISPTAIDWFRSYLYGRRQRVCIEESCSSWCNTSAGVPQGGVLSPLLFAIFINSISMKLLSSYHLYADDLQIYKQASLTDLADAINIINKDLVSICEWSEAHGLLVNPLKTQVIIVGSSRMIPKINWSQLPQVQFNGTAIPLSKKVKNLGIWIDQHLSWDPQLQEVSRKIFASAGSLRRLRNFLPTATKTALAQSLLLPILDYADVSYLDLTEAQLDKLERLQNFCIRFIFGLRKYDHISEFREKLKWFPIRLRRNAHILFQLYSILFNPKTPSYLKERFKFLHDTHNRYLRSSENLRLEMPLHSSRFYDKSFTVEAVRLWNALPVSVRQAKSMSIFKNLVKNHYLSP